MDLVVQTCDPADRSPVVLVMDPSLLDHHHRCRLGTVGSLMVRVLVGEDVEWVDWVAVAAVAVAAALCWTGTLNTIK